MLKTIKKRQNIPCIFDYVNSEHIVYEIVLQKYPLDGKNVLILEDFWK